MTLFRSSFRVAAAVLVGFAACAVPPADDEPGDRTSPPLVARARTAPRMLAQIDALERAGWAVAAWSDARLETVHAPAIAAADATLVLLPVSLDGAHADIAWTPDLPPEDSVVLRPRDARSAAALDRTLVGDPPDTGAGVASAVEVRRCWSCTYIYRLETSLACFALWDNPVGYVQRLVTRSGCPINYNNGIWADYRGNAISCPQPVTGSTIWSRCGLP